MAGAFGFTQGRGIGARHQHDAGFRRVGEAGDGGRVQRLLLFEAGKRPEAGGTVLVGIDKTAPGRGQRQQTQRMAGGGGVEDDMVEGGGRGRVAEQFGDLVKGGNLDRAGAGQLLFHALDGRRRQDVAVRGDHPFAVGGGRRFRVDVQRRQAGHPGNGGGRAGERCFQDFVEVGGRIGADDQDPFAQLGQRQPGRAGERSLADAALAGEEQVARGIVQVDHRLASAAAGFRVAAATGPDVWLVGSGQRQSQFLRSCAREG